MTPEEKAKAIVARYVCLTTKTLEAEIAAALATARDEALEEAACVADARAGQSKSRRDCHTETVGAGVVTERDLYCHYDGDCMGAKITAKAIRALKAPTPAVSDLGGLAKREAAK
jgi:hypothetical protein